MIGKIQNCNLNFNGKFRIGKNDNEKKQMVANIHDNVKGKDTQKSLVEELKSLSIYFSNDVVAPPELNGCIGLDFNEEGGFSFNICGIIPGKSGFFAKSDYRYLEDDSQPVFCDNNRIIKDASAELSQRVNAYIRDTKREDEISALLDLMG